MTPIQQLKALYLEYHRYRYPNFPEAARATPPYMDKSRETGGLTKCIIATFRLHGYMAERISTSGRMLDNSRIVTDVLGGQRRIGSTQWIPGTSTRGSADVEAIVTGGKVVKVEVKNQKTKDKMSKSQISYSEAINISGGVYYIATDFFSFYAWFKSHFEVSENRNALWDVIINSENLAI